MGKLGWNTSEYRLEHGASAQSLSRLATTRSGPEDERDNGLGQEEVGGREGRAARGGGRYLGGVGGGGRNPRRGRTRGSLEAFFRTVSSEFGIFLKTIFGYKIQGNFALSRTP